MKRDISCEICRLFGFDPEKVSTLEILIEAGQPPMVQVVQFITEVNPKVKARLATETRYVLVPVDSIDDDDDEDNEEDTFSQN